MKKKIYLVIFLIVLITFFSGITYSFFNSGATMASSNQGIASFVFEADNFDQIDLNLNGLVPGEEREYLFSVTNANENAISDVTVDYELTIKTYHFMPLVIELYKLEGENEVLFGTCDETTARNKDNEILCKMPTSTLVNSTEQIEDYKLKITFPSEYNDISYSNLVDYINIEIDSWQKIKEASE